jgi:hypothetical protein
VDIVQFDPVPSKQAFEVLELALSDVAYQLIT